MTHTKPPCRLETMVEVALAVATRQLFEVSKAAESFVAAEAEESNVGGLENSLSLTYTSSSMKYQTPKT